eukprot:358822-Chlamydomonas_euryale.AAC.5
MAWHTPPHAQHGVPAPNLKCLMLPSRPLVAYRQSLHPKMLRVASRGDIRVGVGVGSGCDRPRGGPKPQHRSKDLSDNRNRGASKAPWRRRAIHGELRPVAILWYRRRAVQHARRTQPQLSPRLDEP